MPSVTLLHDGNGTASVNTNASGSTTFTLTSISPSTLTVNLVVTVCSSALATGSCTSSPSSVSLPTGESASITVYFTGGTANGTGTITLAAKNTSGSTLSSASVTVTVSQPLPTVSAAPHLGDRRDVGICVADCFESTLSFSTPPYISLDVPRTATLLYRSGRAYPHGTVTLDVTDPYATATTFKLKLKDSTGAYVQFSNGSTELYFTRNPSGPTRIVAQFPATSIPTSARLYTAEVTMFWGTAEQGTAPATVRIIVLNATNSPYGAGVELVGVQRIWFNQSGGVLVTDGTGSATFFAGTCDVNTSCSYTSPSGEFSTLITNAGWFYRTYPDGTQLRYYPDGHHFTTVDRFGSTTQVNYGYNGPYADYLPLSITDPTGQSIAFWYRDAGSLYGTWKEGSLGNIHTPMGDAPIGIDAANNTREWVELGGGAYRWRMTYLSQHLIDTAYDKANSAWKHVYRYGATLAYADAPAVKIDSQVMRNPRVTLRNTGDPLLLAGAVLGGGSSYTAPLAVLTDTRAIVIGPRNDSTLFSLSRFGPPQKTYVPLAPSDSAEYNAAGQVTRTISSTGMDVRYTWSADKLIKVQNVTQGSQDSIVYAAQFSLPAQVISTDGPSQWFAYDQTKTGWPLQSTRVGLSTATPTTHYADARGRDTAVVDPGSHWTKRYYASAGFQNTDSVRSPNGTITWFGRDAWGHVVRTTDAYGASTTAALDVLNRPGWIAGPTSGDTTRFQYDALNNVTSVTDAKNQVYSYQRNVLGWVTKALSPGSLVGDSTAYDVAGNPAYIRTRAGRQVSLLYDALGRVTKKIGVGGADTITYTYASNLRWVKARKVSGGTFVSMDSIATDSVGRKTLEAAYRPAASFVQQNAFQADKPDRISTSLNDNGPGYALQYAYDATKRLSQIAVNSAGTSTIGYDSDNLPTTIQLPSGLTQTTSFTSSHMLARRQYNVQAVQDSLGRAYRTDSLGRLVARYNGDSTKYQTFAYNTANRLASWEKRHRTGTISCASQGDWGYDCNGISVGDLSEGFYYDLVGNPNDASVNLASGNNRLLSYRGVSMLYDADGNLVRRVVGTTTDSLLWDDFGQLKEVRRNGTTIATFAYDGFGRRTRKTAGGTTTQYIWDGDQLRAEANGADTTTQRYSYYPGLDQLHAVTKNGVTYYASIEPSTGDVIGLINGSTNAVVATYNYTPWGEIESSSQTVPGLNSLRWKGLLYDSETGLYYMRARYYDPQVRRFISEDPIGLAGGINMYAFGGGDPVNRIDPSGTCSYDEWQVNNDGSEEPGSRQTFYVTPGASVWLNGTHKGVWYCDCDNETWKSSAPDCGSTGVSPVGPAVPGGGGGLPPGQGPSPAPSPQADACRGAKASALLQTGIDAFTVGLWASGIGEVWTAGEIVYTGALGNMLRYNAVSQAERTLIRVTARGTVERVVNNIEPVATRPLSWETVVRLLPVTGAAMKWSDAARICGGL